MFIVKLVDGSLIEVYCDDYQILEVGVARFIKDDIVALTIPICNILFIEVVEHEGKEYNVMSRV